VPLFHVAIGVYWWQWTSTINIKSEHTTIGYARMVQLIARLFELAWKEHIVQVQHMQWKEAWQISLNWQNLPMKSVAEQSQCRSDHSDTHKPPL
jgi:hypothetical protein